MTAQSRRAKQKPSKASATYTIRGTKRGANPPILPGSRATANKGPQPGKLKEGLAKGRPRIEREISFSMAQRVPIERVKSA